MIMKKFKNILFFIIIIITFFNIAVAENSFKLDVIGKSEYTNSLPKGLSEIAIIYYYNINWPGLGGKTFTPTAENLFKYKNFLPFIETVMKNSNIDFNIENLEIIEKQIYIIVSKAWRDAIRDLMECHQMSSGVNHQGSNLYN